MNDRLKALIGSLESTTGSPAVDYQTHMPTQNELDNLAYLSMKYIAGWLMRSCDFEVVKLIAGPVDSISAMKEKFVPALAEYMWDHLMGEPDDPTQDDVQQTILALTDSLYSMDEKSRNEISESDDEAAAESFSEQYKSRIPPEVLNEITDLANSTGEDISHKVVEFIDKYKGDWDPTLVEMMKMQAVNGYATARHLHEETQEPDRLAKFVSLLLTGCWMALKS